MRQNNFFSFCAGIALSVLVAACTLPLAETPAQVVFGAKNDYRALLTVMVEYESLPRCTGGEIALSCSDPEVVDLIRRADNHASTVLNGAEELVTSPGISEGSAAIAVESAQTAVRVLTQILVDEGLYLEGGT